MGLLDDYSGQGGLLGIGMSPRPAFQHQKIMKRIAFGFDRLFAHKGFESLTEPAISKNPEKAPDVVFFKIEQEEWSPLVFVEITTTKDLKKIIAESRKLMYRLQIHEAFIYDYENGRWNKLYDKESIVPRHNQESWCDTFEIDLNSFLETKNPVQ